MWNWSGPSWTYDMIGTFRVNPDRLTITQGKIPWHTEDQQVLLCICILVIAYCQASCILLPAHLPNPLCSRQAPGSLCSKACQPGEKRLQRSRHHCCFLCEACPAGTFLNQSGQCALGCCILPACLPCPHLASFNQLLASIPLLPQPFPSCSLFLPWSVKLPSWPEPGGSDCVCFAVGMQSSTLCFPGSAAHSWVHSQRRWHQQSPFCCSQGTRDVWNHILHQGNSSRWLSLSSRWHLVSAQCGHEQLAYGNIPCLGQVAETSCLQVTNHNTQP